MEGWGEFRGSAGGTPTSHWRIDGGMGVRFMMEDGWRLTRLVTVCKQVHAGGAAIVPRAVTRHAG